MDQNVYMDRENYINVLEEFSFGVDSGNIIMIT